MPVPTFVLSMNARTTLVPGPAMHLQSPPTSAYSLSTVIMGGLVVLPLIHAFIGWNELPGVALVFLITVWVKRERRWLSRVKPPCVLVF